MTRRQKSGLVILLLSVAIFAFCSWYSKSVTAKQVERVNGVLQAWSREQSKPGLRRKDRLYNHIGTVDIEGTVYHLIFKPEAYRTIEPGSDIVVYARGDKYYGRYGDACQVWWIEGLNSLAIVLLLLSLCLVFQGQVTKKGDSET